MVSPKDELLFSTVVTHRDPHVDEILGYLLLRRYGRRRFQGIENAEIVFIDAGTDTYQAMNGHQLLPTGIVALGVCGGPFDEHPRDCRPSKKTSTAQMVFQFLQEHDAIPAEDVLAWLPIVERVCKNDTRGDSAPLDIFRTVGNLYKLKGGGCEEEAIAVAEISLELQFEVNLKMIQARHDYQQNADIRLVKLADGREVRVAAIRSNNRFLLQLCSTDLADKPAVFIQKNSRGQIQVHTFKKYGLTLADGVALIRLAEADRRALVINDDPGRLRFEGKVEGAECWYYQKPVERLLNGSTTAAAVDPTRLLLAEVRDLIVQGLISAIHPGPRERR